MPKKLEKYQEIERSIITTYRKTLWSPFVLAVKKYRLIQAGDKIAVCISGGKDSMLLAKLMQQLERHSEVPFSLVFLVMDPGYNEANRRKIEENAKLLNVPITVFESDVFQTAETVSEESPCYLCARMRRGHLYAKAKALGCNKIALGHHYDDVIETILMSMLYNGQVQSMLPKLKSDNFENMELIRPLYYVRERDIVAWKKHNELTFIQCACRLTERLNDEGGTGESKRQETKNLIAMLEKQDRYVPRNIFKSVYNVQLGAVIEYKDKQGTRHNFLDDYDEE